MKNSVIQSPSPGKTHSAQLALVLSACWALNLFFPLTAHSAASPDPSELNVGVAQIDITPDYPVRLSGFGFRRTESEGVTQKIWAKALAFADDQHGPAVLITADNLCVPDQITQELAQRLAPKIHLKRERLSVTASHTHTAPMLKNVAPTLFSGPIPPEHQQNIDRYTAQFIDQLEQVALEAVKAIQPARVSWGLGQATFAVNRRTKGGPVDHDLPILVVRNPQGDLRAIYFSYACHCVTLSNNKISGDWAGFAQDEVQKLFPGAIALASVGCGADSNPSSGVTGDKTDICADQGRQIATEIKRLLNTDLKPITQRPVVHYARLDLAFDTPRSRAEWEQRAQNTDAAVAYHARVNLARLDRGESLPAHLNYPIQSWIFGDQLAIVLLPGETVVDYSLRLKREFDRFRLWVNGYSNDGRCYIPSERILKEGGYEGGGAMIYYDMPNRFAPGLEQKIINTVSNQIPRSFSAPKGTEGTRPLSARESVSQLRTKPGLTIELVAAEPLVTSPVAIDWGADGKLWVCEMVDYPTGLDENWLPGGRVRFLEDADHDGAFERSTIFLDQLPFPTGVTAWGRGVLICAAPDVLYAQDTNGDGKADQVEKLFSGFATGNYQARVNSLSLGLDNWIYGANGLLSSAIIHHGNSIDIRNRDFRFRPLKGIPEPVSGLSQQGRARDDWGNWFGCDNSRALLFFPYEERYLRRNPHIPSPNPVLSPPADFDVSRIYPRSRTLERFNDLDQANRVTSACGLGLYRDTLLGEEFYGNSFTCEPVHNLVHRQILSPENDQFLRRRAPDESQSEFLASSDNWFRPVQACTGPDGALYVVDMYRFLVEHPRWIPAARLAQLDVRAGANMGRIYRIKPSGKPLRPIRDLTQLNPSDLGRSLNSPNGAERDRVHIELLFRRDPASAIPLAELAASASSPQVRLQALAALDGLGALTPKLLQARLADSDPNVRIHAIRLSEPFLASSEPAVDQLQSKLLSLTNESVSSVARQLAFTLGEWSDPRSSAALAALARRHLANDSVRVAALSSAQPSTQALLNSVLDLPDSTPGRAAWITPLAATAAGANDRSSFARALLRILPSDSSAQTPAQFTSAASLLAALKNKDLTEFLRDHADLNQIQASLAHLSAAAHRIAPDSSLPAPVRAAAISILNYSAVPSEHVSLLADLLLPPHPDDVRSAATAALQRQSHPDVATQIINRWPRLSPGTRSALVPLLLSRDSWVRPLLAAVQAGKIPGSEIPPATRPRLAQNRDPKIRQAFTQLFAPSQSRALVLQQYQTALTMTGSPAKGADLFSKNCASCHFLNSMGHHVGPDLEPLRTRDPDYWLQNILDPNAAIEPRFVTYELHLKDERSLSGIVQNESATSITLAQSGGIKETILRSDIKEIRASNLSLMPEALEQAIPPEDMAHLIAFLRSPNPPDHLLRDPVSIARLILDKTQSDAAREAVIKANPQFAADLIAEMTRDLTLSSPEEYVRIPWIWRVATACGKRNDPAEIRRVLDVSLPKPAQPLADWQAVVLGGGIIHGLSLRNLWPSDRLQEILQSDPSLQSRWAQALQHALQLAHREKTPTGTRYDALRMLALKPWDTARPHLTRYLRQGTHEELQMGAVSGLSDVNSSEAGAALATALPNLAKSSRPLALDALLRTNDRVNLLLDAIAAGQISRADLGPDRIQILTNHSNPDLRARARQLLQP